MKLGLYKKMTYLSSKIKRSHLNTFIDPKHFISDLMDRIDHNLNNPFMEILKYCKKNDLDLLMHDDIVRHLNNELVFKYHKMLFSEIPGFKKIKEFVDNSNINIYIYTSMFMGLNSKSVELREKARRDIVTKAQLMEEIGGTGIIYQPNTYRGKKWTEALDDIKISYDLIKNDITDKYFMLSNGFNAGRYEEIFNFTERVKWKRCYQPIYEISHSMRLEKDFYPEYDKCCAENSDIIIFIPYLKSKGNLLKKKEFVDYGDFPKYYYDLDKTFIINSYNSDKSIESIKKELKNNEI